MQRRLFLQALAATAAIPAAGTALANPRPSALLHVQVRVFRKPNNSTWVFLPGVLVRLSNGMTGTTSNQPGMRGTAHFPRLPRQRYTARALVNGRWYNATAFQANRPSDPPWRIDIQIP